MSGPYLKTEFLAIDYLSNLIDMDRFY